MLLETQVIGKSFWKKNLLQRRREGDGEGAIFLSL